MWWKRVNHTFEVPLNALILSTIVCALLGLIYLGSSAAFNAFTGVATICLGCSYAFPVLCSVLRRRKLVKNAPYSLGMFGYAIVSSPQRRPDARTSSPLSGLHSPSSCSASPPRSPALHRRR